MQLIIDGTEPPALLESISGFIMFLARSNGEAPALSEGQDAATGAGEGTQTPAEPPETTGTEVGPKKRGPKKKAQPEQTQAPAAPATTGGPDKDAVRAAMQSVIEVESLGMESAMGIVGRFKDAEGNACQTLKGLQPGDYAAVIEACAEAVTGAGKAAAANSLMGD